MQRQRAITIAMIVLLLSCLVSMGMIIPQKPQQPPDPKATEYIDKGVSVSLDGTFVPGKIVKVNEETPVNFNIQAYPPSPAPGTELQIDGFFRHQRYDLNVSDKRVIAANGTITKVRVPTDGGPVEFTKASGGGNFVFAKLGYSLKWMGNDFVRIFQSDHRGPPRAACNPPCRTSKRLLDWITVTASFDKPGEKWVACRAGLTKDEWDGTPCDPIETVGMITKDGKFEIKHLGDIWGACRTTIWAVQVEIKSLEFTSDITRRAAREPIWLRDKNDAFGDENEAKAVTPFQPPEWTKSKSDPIAQEKATSLQVRLVLDILPKELGSRPYTITGRDEGMVSRYPSIIGFLSFDGAGNVTCGPDVALPPMLSKARLPDSVGVLAEGVREMKIKWSMALGGKNFDLDRTGPHVIFRSFSTPFAFPNGSYVTTKRIDFCCTTAEGKKVPEDVADSLWKKFSGNPPLEAGSPGTDPAKTLGLQNNSSYIMIWKLMDGAPWAAYCDFQARLMVSGCRLIGLPASMFYITASTNPWGRCGAGEVGNNFWQRDPPTDVIGMRPRYLIFDANPGGDASLQFWEGACLAAGKTYTIWPSLKADSPYDMFMKLMQEQGWQQHWCTMSGNIPVIEVRNVRPRDKTGRVVE